MPENCRSTFAKCLFVFLIVAASAYSLHAEATTIAYDGIDYQSDTLMEGKNGGTGWTASWRFDYYYGENFKVTSSGLTYAGLATTGGAMTWTSGGNGISANDRSIPLQNSGIVYVQFLSHFDSTSAYGTPNVRLLHDGEYVAGFGGNGGAYQGVVSILDGDLNAAADGSSSSTVPLGQLNLVIARIDYTAQSTSMWVNPDLSTFDYLLPPTAQATFAGLAPAFDAVGAYSRNPGTVDEIRVMSVVPESHTMALFAIGSCILLLRRFRQHQANCPAA